MTWRRWSEQKILGNFKASLFMVKIENLDSDKITLYLVRISFSKIEPVTCKILTFLPKNTGIELKTMHT